MNNCKFILANIKTGSIIDDLQIEKTGVAIIISFATENKMDTPISLEEVKKKPTEPMGSRCSCIAWVAVSSFTNSTKACTF
jgi:hypothetical protein